VIAAAVTLLMFQSSCLMPAETTCLEMLKNDENDRNFAKVREFIYCLVYFFFGTEQIFRSNSVMFV